MPRTLTAWMTILLTCAALVGCSSETDETADAREPALGYDVPMRGDAELAAALGALCETALATRTSSLDSPSAPGSPPQLPVLVEFSAAWCSDCQRLGEMKQAPALADELSKWPNITVNVGQFDRHRDILDSMKIESIAHWAILQPTNCADPIDRWARIADRTLEVSSGAARNLTPADLAAWLRGFRTS